MKYFTRGKTRGFYSPYLLGNNGLTGQENGRIDFGCSLGITLLFSRAVKSCLVPCCLPSVSDLHDFPYKMLKKLGNGHLLLQGQLWVIVFQYCFSGVIQFGKF